MPLTVPFTPGFSDFFAELAQPGTVFSDQSQINQMFDRVGHYNAKSLRFQVRWDAIETADGVYDWSPLNHVILHAYYRGLKLVPHVLGAPAWLGNANRVQIVESNDPTLYYPKEGKHVDFGQFVAEMLTYMSYFGVCRAVEVWNEPNLAKFGIPAPTFKSMLSETLAAVNARTYPVPMTVISGGLGQNGSNWQQYLTGFMAQCYPYAVGLHPYDTRNFSGETLANAKAMFLDRVKSRFNEAYGMVTTDVWVTEFGCGADTPFDEQVKAELLVNLAGAGGFFASKARCKGVFLYRFLPQAVLGDDNPGLFHTYPMLKELVPDTSYEELQPTQYFLQQNWAGAPS